jgi:AcrR family transcriptional regulator
VDETVSFSFTVSFSSSSFSEMIAIASSRATTKRGDPVPGRGEAREEAILGATLELLAEVGYDRMSMDAIAVRARAGKATIYRHWSGQGRTGRDRGRAARRAADGRAAGPGDLRVDLLGTMRAMRDGLTEQGAGLLLGRMTAMHHDEELARTVRARMVDDKRQAFDPAIDRGGQRRPARDDRPRAARGGQLGDAVLACVRHRSAARRRIPDRIRRRRADAATAPPSG